MQIEADDDEDEPQEPEDDIEDFIIAKPGAVAFGKKEESKRKK